MDSKIHFSLLHCWFPNTAAHQKYLEGFLDNTEATFFPFYFPSPQSDPWILSRAGRHIHVQTGPGACLSTLAPDSPPWFSCSGHTALLFSEKAHLVPTLPFAFALSEYSAVSPSCDLFVLLSSYPSLIECHHLTETILAIAMPSPTIIF